MKQLIKFILSYITSVIAKLKAPKTVHFYEGSMIDSKCRFEGYNSVGANAKLSGVSLGVGSYVGVVNISNVKIGRYCSIASGLKIISGRHPTHTFVSTSPIFFSTRRLFGLTFNKEQHFEEVVKCENGYDVVIGSDVWVGEDVTIMQGVTIGDGAIIGANSLVLKDVEPYSIVGGVPAKHIRQRFSESQISDLLRVKWWEDDWDNIISNIDKFKNIDIFLNNSNKL